MKIFISIIFLLGCSLVYGQTPSGEEILKKVDSNYVAENRKCTLTMTISEERGSRTLQAQAWIQGMDKAYTEYLSPARDMGTKLLKLEDELWIYTPSTDRTIKIAGHMLRQSIMGSDLSYEDYMEDPILCNMYNAEVKGEENVNGVDCYVLNLTAKKEDITYFSRKMWVDKERYLPMKEERYAKSGKLLKTLEIKEITKIGDRWYPKRMVFRDILKEGGGTEFVFDSIEFDVEIPDYIFSKASLRKS